jgi:RNA polymerase sigma-70 factor (ECF subfamily)
MSSSKDELMDDPMKTRASLLKKLKDWQDRASWQEFFDTYWKLIYGAARQAGLAEDEAQDAVQETMIRVAKHMPGFTYDPAIGRFRAWLKTLTRQCIVGQFRKRGPRAKQTETGGPMRVKTRAVEQVLDSANGIDDRYWDREWERNLLDAAIEWVKKKKPHEYQIYYFLENLEWPVERVAKEFKVTPNRVYLIKHRLTKMITARGQRLERGMLRSHATG